MQSASMPETAIDKNSASLAGKNKVRFAEEWDFAPPTGDMAGAENLKQPQFRRLVPVGTHCCHCLGPFGFSENVSHNRQSLIRNTTARDRDSAPN